VRCDEVRGLAAELALDELTGAERATALGHLSQCPECRAEVAELAAVADAVLLVAPSVEPPAGFESRVLARLAPPRSRSWVGRVAGIAAAAALLGGVAGFALARGDDATSTLPIAAVFHSASGEPNGSLVLLDGPDRMTCVFEGERFGGDYAVEVELAGGEVTEVGRFTAAGPPWTWTVELPTDATEVRRVIVRDGEGVVRATADV
jgi:hypothetical protein